MRPQPSSEGLNRRGPGIRLGPWSNPFSLYKGPWPWEAPAGSEAADFVSRLAEAMRTDVAMLYAIADGEVDVDRILGYHPVGGSALLGTLAEYHELILLVADEGPNGYEAQQRRYYEKRAAARQAVATKATPQRPCVLYRLYGTEDRLLYVGVSRNPTARLKAHRRKWGDLIVRVETEEFDTAQEMFAAEAEWIRRESPPLNVAGVDGDDGTRK